MTPEQKLAIAIRGLENVLDPLGYLTRKSEERGESDYSSWKDMDLIQSRELAHRIARSVLKEIQDDT